MTSQWVGVTYEIFVQSFADSNGDGIGDLCGVIEKLDYLSELGVRSIWLMPIHPSPSYHKYDITNYYEVHPDYGTLDDFKLLVEEAHKRNIKVIMDLVINHCSKHHPWFVSALNPESSHRDFFIWSDMKSIKKEGSLKKKASADSDNVIQWNKVAGQDELYYAFFWSGMPDFNFDHPQLREEIYKIASFWLSEMNVDGFRLDAAKHIYPEHRIQDTQAFWETFKDKMQALKPDVVLVGEVWADHQTQLPFANGFTSLFDFDLALSILETVKKGETDPNLSKGSPVHHFIKSQEAFKEVNRSFSISTFLSNHDQKRVRSFFKDSVGKSKLAASILLTMAGIPHLYYGEELGMRGTKPDEKIREPFLWSSGSKHNTSWQEVQFNTSDKVAPLENQLTDDQSIYHHYKSLLSFRNQSDVLKYGELSEGPDLDERLLCFYRTFGSDQVLVIHNLYGRKKSTNFNGKRIIWHSGKRIIKPIDDLLTLLPFQTLVLEA